MVTHHMEDEWRIPIQKMQVGDTLTTKSRVITRTELELFALLGGDTAAQFLSSDASRSAGWKDQLVPGLCTLNIAYGLLIQAGFLKDIVAYMGTDNMQFLLPVYPGDSIRVETKVTGKNETDKGWFCEYDWTIRNQESRTVATGRNT